MQITVHTQASDKVVSKVLTSANRFFVKRATSTKYIMSLYILDSSIVFRLFNKPSIRLCTL